MLRLDRTTRTFARLRHRSLTDSGILERHDLQAMIAASPEEFFAELGEPITLLAQEVKPDDLVDDRIDLLAADADGAAVIIELKRGNHRMQLLQALSYAGMLSNMDGAEFIERAARFSDRSRTMIEENLEEFVEGGIAAVNQSQRVVLIAEGFDYSVLITAKWLSDKYGVPIRCYRLKLAGDQATEFLSCERVYPLAELPEQSERVRIPSDRQPRYRDWDEALAGIENQAVVQFFKEELANNRKGYLDRRILNWHQAGHRRFWVRARQDFAYGWQIGRFEGDLAFWRARLGGTETDVGIVGRHNNRVRFRLRSQEQIAAFRDAVTNALANQKFLRTAIIDDEPEGNEVEGQ